MSDFQSFNTQITRREGDNPPQTYQTVTPEHGGSFVPYNQFTFWGLESDIIFDCSQQTYQTVPPEHGGSFVDHLGSDGVHNKIIHPLNQCGFWGLESDKAGPAPAPDETSPEVLPPCWNPNSTALPDKHNHDQCKDNLDINTSSTKMRAPYIIHLN